MQKKKKKKKKNAGSTVDQLLINIYICTGSQQKSINVFHSSLVILFLGAFFSSWVFLFIYLFFISPIFSPSSSSPVNPWLLILLFFFDFSPPPVNPRLLVNFGTSTRKAAA